MNLGSKAICILGMHRSGTSTVTRVVNCMGASLGEKNDLLPAADQNPEGFWEREDIIKLHDKMLFRFNRRWDTVVPLPDSWHRSKRMQPLREELVEIIKINFSEHELWAWKDPRSTILFPVWRDILDELGIELSAVYVIRNPLDVARSLKKRNGFSYRKSFNIWFNYNIAAMRETVGIPTACISYDKLLNNWELELKRCANKIGIRWPKDDSVFVQEVNSFIRPDLRHSASNINELRRSGAPDYVVELYALLLCILEDGKTIDSSCIAKLDALVKTWKWKVFVSHNAITEKINNNLNFFKDYLKHILPSSFKNSLKKLMLKI
jgi:hypothetical protein